MANFILENKPLFIGESVEKHLSSVIIKIKNDLTNIKSIEEVESSFSKLYEKFYQYPPNLLETPSIKAEEAYINTISSTEIMTATLFTFLQKFSGENLFYIIPSKHTDIQAKGLIVDNFFKWIYINELNLPSSKIKNLFEENLTLVVKNLSYLKDDLDRFNFKLKSIIQELITNRINKLNKMNDDLNSFGYNIIR